MTCYDTFSGRYFEITEDKLKEILCRGEFEGINAFYDFVGLAHAPLDEARECLWGYSKVRADFRFATLEDGREVVIFSFQRPVTVWVDFA